MVQLIATIVFLTSALAIVFILYRKVPALVKLPQNGKTGIREYYIVSNIEDKIKDIFLSFKKQIILHKFLSWVKIVTLKTETKIDTYLHRIRKRAQRIDKDLKDKK